MGPVLLPPSHIKKKQELCVTNLLLVTKMLLDVKLVLVLAAMTMSVNASTTLRWFDESVSYETAKQRCEEEGLELAKADTFEINIRMGNMVRNDHWYMEVWIGLRDKRNGQWDQNIFEWEDGERYRGTGYWGWKGTYMHLHGPQFSDGDCAVLHVEQPGS